MAGILSEASKQIGQDTASTCRIRVCKVAGDDHPRNHNLTILTTESNPNKGKDTWQGEQEATTGKIKNLHNPSMSPVPAMSAKGSTMTEPASRA